MAGTHRGETMPTQKYVPSLILKKADEHGGPISDFELWSRVNKISIDTVDLSKVQDHIKDLTAHQFLTEVSGAHETTKRYCVTNAGHKEAEKHTAHAQRGSFVS